MHTALVVECADEVGASGAQLLADEALKETVFAACQADGLQFRLGDGRTSFVLLYHGRQLLVVTDKDKLVDVAAAHGVFAGRLLCTRHAVLALMTGEESDEIGLQNLRALVDDGQREVFQRKEIGA